MTPADLSRLAPLLDQALDLPLPEREAWLAALEGEAASLAPTLRKLLVRSASRDTADLLERGPAFDLPSSGPLPGDTVGPYRLLSELGTGGMGAVWLAERSDGSLKRKVALKLPHLGWAPGLAERFAREREILSNLEHPYIARLYDAGLDAQGRPFMALEYVEGQPLDVYCRERALSIPARLRLLLQVAEAVAFAHGRLVLHRDLKPANILVTAEGQVRLLDFGIAKLMQGDSTAETALTQASGRALTLDYASPEQIRGAAIGTASDVYSLGVVAFELLAGVRPYRLKRGSAAELEEAITGQDLPLASTVASDVATVTALRGDLDAILNQALKKDAAVRYGSVDALAQEWRRHLDGARVLARPDALRQRVARLARRHRVALGAGTAVLSALLVGLGAALWQAQQAREQALIARTEAKTAAAVQAFLEDIFRANRGDQADPAKARQRTAKELLDDGAAHIDKALDDAPAAKLRVLKLLSDMYADMGATERQIELRTAAAALAARAFPGPSIERARALAALAAALGASARLTQAGDALRQAQAIAEQNPRLDDALRIEIAMAFVEDHMRRDDAAGLDASARLVALLRARPPSVDLVGALLMRGRLQRVAGQFASSVQTLQDALTAAAGAPGGAAAGLSTVHMELSRSLAVAGDLRGAEQQQRQALAQAQQNAGPASFQAVLGFQALAGLLADLGRPAEGLPLLDQMHQALAQWPNDLARAQAAEGGATVEIKSWLRLGQPERALAVLAALAPLPLQELDDPRARVELWWAEAEALIDLGRLHEAGAALERAARLMSDREVAANSRQDVGLAKIRLLLLQGQVEPARAVWREIQSLGQSSQPLALATEADLEFAAAGPAAALALATRHLAAFDAGRPRPEQVYARFRLLVVSARAMLALDRGAQALVPLDQALALNASSADIDSSPARLEALVLRAQAELASGRGADAARTLAEAAAILTRHRQLGPQFTEPLERTWALAGLRPPPRTSR